MKKSSKIENFAATDIDELYEWLIKIPRSLIDDAVHNLFLRAKTPLVSAWKSKEEFDVSYNIFSKLARSTSKEEFVLAVTNQSLPDGVDVGRSERILFHDFDWFSREVENLGNFFDSLPEYFSYEVSLMSSGYPCAKVS